MKKIMCFIGWFLFWLVAVLLFSMWFISNAVASLPPTDPNEIVSILCGYMDCDPNTKQAILNGLLLEEPNESPIVPNPNLLEMNDWIQKNWPRKFRVIEYEHLQATGTMFIPPVMTTMNQPAIMPWQSFIYTVHWTEEGVLHRWAWIFEHIGSGLNGWNDYVKGKQWLKGE